MSDFLHLKNEQDITELELNGSFYLKRQLLPTGTSFLKYPGPTSCTPTVYEEVSEADQDIEVDITDYITCQSCIYYKVVGGRPHSRPK